MTDALIIPTSFGGKHIPIIEKDGDLWMPCKDLSIAFGLDRTTCFQHVKRKREFFGPAAQDGDKLSQDGDIWINEVGFYMLLSGIKAPKGSDAEILISQFRKTVPELIQQYRKKEIVPATAEPEKQELDEVVSYGLIEAKQIAELTGTDPKVMQAAFLRAHGYPEFADVLVPSVIHGEAGWFKPGELAHQCGLSTEQFNHWLNNNPKDPDRRPFQYKDHDTRLWRLTPLGMEHGAEYPYTVEFTGHTEVRIKWRESILKACGLKRDIAPDQTALPARAGR